MSQAERLGLVIVGVVTLLATSSVAYAQNHAPNPYRTVEGVWAPLPDGREWGSTSLVEVSPDGETIWAVDRCGENTCVGHDDLDVVFQFDKDGNMLKRWGAGMFVWPHGIDVDDDGNVWVADARGEGNRGHQVIKFSSDGDVLMRLGTAGVAGRTQSTFDQPNDVLVAPNGDIFVGDGHPANGNNRIVKFSSDGTYLMEWGETGSAPGQFRTPHALAMDSQGLLYVGDRSNRRIQVFEQDGTFVRDFYNFGRASGVAIDGDDNIYVADSESNYRRNGGYKRGIRVANISDLRIFAFIPDPEPNQDNSGTSAAEGVAVDNEGNVYGAEVGPRALRKHVKR
ncbi:MAG: peptidyl-alpha-hydroxyglycine alpha-amidating lyase family protein [Vicinamibacterales bacterium]|nr:peptidyl-alpha-hydroxyglycine alpha-amidating lyase family protein [Vicinamibacterales bacterium]